MCSSDKEILSFPSDLPCVSSFEIPEDSSAWFSKHFVWVWDRSSSGSLGKLWLTSIRNVSGIHWQVFPALCFTPASVQKAVAALKEFAIWENLSVHMKQLASDQLESCVIGLKWDDCLVVADQSMREEGGVTEKVGAGESKDKQDLDGWRGWKR